MCERRRGAGSGCGCSGICPGKRRRGSVCSCRRIRISISGSACRRCGHGRRFCLCLSVSSCGSARLRHGFGKSTRRRRRPGVGRGRCGSRGIRGSIRHSGCRSFSVGKSGCCSERRRRSMGFSGRPGVSISGCCRKCRSMGVCKTFSSGKCL